MDVDVAGRVEGRIVPANTVTREYISFLLRQ